MSSAVERKLTTILCADVCGYSRMMGQDEEGTLDRLKTAREVFSKHIHEHSGRIVNMTGDGLVAEFASVVQALQCAVTVQNLFGEQNLGKPAPEAMVFRIGLNLGDVIIEGDDIFGDGVNVASRLEAITPNGGVCISGTVYDHVKGKFPTRFNFLGEKNFKNIAEPVPVYSVGLAKEGQTQSDNPYPNNAPPEQEPTSPSIDDEEEQNIRRQVKKEASFYRRALSMGTIIFFLFIINILTSADYLWFIWPALPILLILSMDALRVFGKGPVSDRWEEKKVNEIKARKRRKYHE